MSDTTRAAFEAYFSESRKSKGAGRAPTFERFPDGTYKDDHTQRHWWTWQQATRAQAPAAEPLDAEMMRQAKAECDDDYTKRGIFISGWIGAERAHGIGAAKEQP